MYVLIALIGIVAGLAIAYIVAALCVGEKPRLPVAWYHMVMGNNKDPWSNLNLICLNRHKYMLYNGAVLAFFAAVLLAVLVWVALT